MFVNSALLWKTLFKVISRVLTRSHFAPMYSTYYVYVELYVLCMSPVFVCY